jgi:chromosome segregation ATPase
MSSELEEFRERQGKFDVRLSRLEETVRIQADLRAAMDSDISDIKQEQRAQRGMLQALATTQSEHTRRLTSIEGRLGDVEQRLGNVESRLGAVESRLGAVEITLGNVQVGVQTIIAMLDRQIAGSGS